MISRSIIFFSIFLYCSSLVYSTHFFIGSTSFCVYRRRPYWNIEWRFLGLVVGAEVKSSGCPFRRWIEESGGDAGKAVRMADDQDLPTDCPPYPLWGANIIDSWEMHLNIRRKKSPDSLKTRRNVIRLRWKRTQKLPGCCVLWLLLPFGIGKLIDK